MENKNNFIFQGRSDENYEFFMKFVKAFSCFLAIFIAVGTASARVSKEANGNATSSNLQSLGTEELIRSYCSTDGKNIYKQWRGSVYAFVPQERQQKLFNIIGMNVARCFQDDQGQWHLTSRELTFYLDPQTNEILENWQNPWTQEVVPVVHLANNPVQNVVRGEYPVFVDGENVTFLLDIPLTYPNVLGNNPKFKDYSPQKLYQAGEFFKFTVPLEEATDISKATTESFSGAWTRLGPWLPWMKMGDRPGQLVYSAAFSKFRDFEEMSPVLQKLITSRLPVYKKAPRCFLEVGNETSWTYFRKHFNEYLRGGEFPIPEFEDNRSCS